MKEEWKYIKEFDLRYQISSLGNVKSLRTNKNIYQHIDKRGYMTCLLFKEGKIFTKKIHRLVAEAFIPNPFNKPQVNHIDFNTSNNIVSNLEWCFSKENIQHSLKNNRWNNKIKSITNNKHACKKIISLHNGYTKEFDSINEAIKFYNISRTIIYRCLSGKQSSIRSGLTFKYST